MLQKNYSITLPADRQEEFLKEIQPLLLEMEGQAQTYQTSCLYLHLVFSGVMPAMVQSIQQLLREKLPQAVITGMNTKGSQRIMRLRDISGAENCVLFLI